MSESPEKNTKLCAYLSSRSELSTLRSPHISAQDSLEINIQLALSKDDVTTTQVELQDLDSQPDTEQTLVSSLALLSIKMPEPTKEPSPKLESVCCRSIERSETTNICFNCDECLRDLETSSAPGTRTSLGPEILNIADLTSQIITSKIISPGAATSTQPSIFNEEKFEDQQSKLHTVEAALEMCELDLQAAKSEIALAQQNAAKYEALVSDISEELRKIYTILALEIALPPPRSNAEGEDVGYLAFMHSSQDIREYCEELDADHLLNLSSDPKLRVNMVHDLAKVSRTESAHLNQRLKASEANHADIIAQFALKNAECISLRTELLEQKDLANNEQQTKSTVQNELELLRQDCINKEPLIKVGAAIRLRFLEQSKTKLFGVSADFLDRDILEDGNAAAHSGNAIADIALLTTDLCDTVDVEDTFRRVYQHPSSDYVSVLGPMLRATFDMQVTAVMLTGTRGINHLRLQHREVTDTIWALSRQNELEGTANGTRLLRRLQGIVCEMVNGRERTNRRGH